MAHAAKGAPRAGADPDDEVFTQRAVELKDEANALYGRGAVKRALEVYEHALNLLPERDQTRAQIHSNRAACFSKMQCYADVVAEANRALALDGKSYKAYWHRAQAYMQLGQVGKAKKDLAQVIAIEPSYTDAQDALDALNGTSKAGAPAGLGGMTLAPGKKGKKSAKKGDSGDAGEDAKRADAEARYAAAAKERAADPPAILIKAAFGDDVRMFSVWSTIGFKDLQKSIATKFAFEGQFSIKYEDEEGNVKNVHSRNDFQKSIYATSARLRAMEKPPLIPYVKLIVQELPKVEDIEVVDEDGNPVGLAPNEVVEIDEWILDFSSLFREHLGIDAEGHLDLHHEGTNLSNDLTNTNLTDEEAKELRDAAIEKFQACAAATIFNWGNVHMCEARKKMDGGREPAKEEGGPPGSSIAIADQFDEVERLIALATQRYEEALAIKPDHHDSHIALAQRRYERSRLLSAAAGMSGDEGKVAKGHDAKKRIAEAEAEFIGAVADYKAVFATLPDEVPKEKTEEEKAAFQALVDEAVARGDEPPADEEPSLKGQVRVMLGNTLFEQSQLAARLGKEWKPLLDEALENFHEAGCAQEDIDNAVSMHYGTRMCK